MRRLGTVLIIVLALMWPMISSAQTTAADTASAVVNDDQWLALAARAEALAGRDDLSEFAITRLRAELVDWRDTFLDLTELNAGRLATINAQLTAIGAAPEDGDESAEVTERREALQAQRRTLSAPAVLAQEAYARANGLISELDAQVLQQQAAELTQRGVSPLNPNLVVEAIKAVGGLGINIWSETFTGVSQRASDGALWQNLPRSIFLIVLAVFLLRLGRRWITAWQQAMAQRDTPSQPVWLLILSALQIAVSVGGLFALASGIEVLGVFGTRGEVVVSTLPVAGLAVVFGWWLGRQVFPAEAELGYLGHDEGTRISGRLYTLILAWVMGFAVLGDAAVQTIEIDEGTQAAIEWPVLALIGILLWLLGRVIRCNPMQLDDETQGQGRLRRVFGLTCTAVAIIGPLLAAMGYMSAGRLLLISSVLSLALIGVVFLLQRVAYRLFSPQTDDENADKGAFALLPVLISFTLFILSLPIFALIWGTRVSDLQEIWTRFREGFALGETRISPTDFLTFAIVFALGYLLTRFIQGTLRKSVMPRTRLDIGGQNAIVSGFGYVGIILAAIIAITSAGIDLSNLAIVAGALSVGIGFGLQNIVSNFVSGIILLIERPVSEGDWIEVGDQMGYVRAISVRSTRIETFDKTDVIVPNADLVSGQVINWTRGSLIGRVIIPVGVAYGTDTQKASEILKGIAEAHPMVLMNPAPVVLFQGFGADALDFEIRAILRDVNYVLSAKSEINHEIAKQFAEAGIEIPFAQRDIWLRNAEVLGGGNGESNT